MRLQIIFITLLLSGFSFASSEKDMAELFQKYDAIVKEHKFELVDEIFTKKFLKDVGGKDEFITNIKEFPRENKKSSLSSRVQWKKGSKGEMFFAKKVQTSNLKSKTGIEPKNDTSFIIVKENGKLKIDGTISDDH